MRVCGCKPCVGKVCVARVCGIRVCDGRVCGSCVLDASGLRGKGSVSLRARDVVCDSALQTHTHTHTHTCTTWQGPVEMACEHSMSKHAAPCTV